MAIGKPSTSISYVDLFLVRHLARRDLSDAPSAPQRRERVDEVVKSRFPCDMCGKAASRSGPNAVASNALRTL